MANFKYFADINGKTIELSVGRGGLQSMSTKELADRFPGVKAKRCDSFSVWAACAPDKTLAPVTRMIEFKKRPSLHECDARCLGARGKTCECSCRGRNHGVGSLSCEVAA
jgi:hypothetical protein